MHPSKVQSRDESGRFAGSDGKPADPELAPVDKPQQKTDVKPQTSEDPGAATPPQAAAATTAQAAPTSWAKEKHQIWGGLPREAQDYILQRERESQEGVQQLKRQYEEIDAVIAPHKPLIQRFNQTPGQTIRQLFEWNAALAGPYKTEAFRQLAERFQIDVSQLAPRQPLAATDGGQQGATDLQSQEALRQLQARQQQMEAHLIQQQQAAAEREVQRATAEVQAWAKDKPHFERVRLVMQELVGVDQMAINQGQQPRMKVIKADGSVDLDRAYTLAINMDDELRSQVETERTAAERAKAAEARTAADKAAEAERARKAGVSIKPNAAATPVGRAAQKPPANESARATIMRSLKELQK